MIGPVVEFVAVKLGIFPVPDAAKPISVLSLVQVYDIVPELLLKLTPFCEFHPLDKWESNVVLNSTASVSSPLQSTWSEIASTPTVWFTVITTSNESPLHPLNSGWTSYVNVAGESVVLVNVWLIDDWDAPSEPPVIAPAGLLTGADQLYVVPSGTISVGELSVGWILNVSPSQIVSSLSAITGTGWIVKVYSKGVPAHPSAIGVIV